jgi:hypothetical protein
MAILAGQSSRKRLTMPKDTLENPEKIWDDAIARARAFSGDLSSYPPLANRGGTLCLSYNPAWKTEENKDKSAPATVIDPLTGDARAPTPAQTTPPLRGGGSMVMGEVTDPVTGHTRRVRVPRVVPKKITKSRAEVTDADTREFLARHARFDWLACTVPNGFDGTGLKRDDSEKAAADEELQATQHIMRVMAALELYEVRKGRGSDGYPGAMTLNADPLSKDRQVTVRTGHPLNMPSFEITGADGQGHRMARYALRLMGPLICSRVDVALDLNHVGLFDDLFEHAKAVTKSDAKARMAPPTVTDAGSGRTFSIGGSKRAGAGKPEAEIVVYEKGLEQKSKGKALPDGFDENWVRVELRLRPKKAKKTGIAKTAKEDGPAALLGAVLWVRKFIKEVVRLVGVTDQPKIGVTRLDNRPDPASAREKAEKGIAQYAGTVLEAAVVRIAHDEFDGDFQSAAGVTFDRVIEESRLLLDDIFTSHVRESGKAENLVDRLELDSVSCRDLRAYRLAMRLHDYVDYQARETHRAHRLLDRALHSRHMNYPALLSERAAA